MRAGQEVADLGFDRGNPCLRYSKTYFSSLIKGAGPPSRFLAIEAAGQRMSGQDPVGLIVIYVRNIGCCNVPLSAFLAQ
jgi:hypothetical protein